MGSAAQPVWLSLFPEEVLAVLSGERRGWEGRTWQRDWHGGCDNRKGRLWVRWTHRAWVMGGQTTRET